MNKKWIVIGTLAAVLALGGVGAFGAAVFAQSPTGTPTPNQGQGTNPGNVPGFGFGFGPGMMGGRGGFGGAMMGGFGVNDNSLIAIAAKALNMTEADLRTALQDGTKSIADVANGKEVSLDTIVNAVVTQYSDNLKTAVTAGRLTQAQADTLTANYKVNVTAQLNIKFVSGTLHDSLLTVAAKAIGISESDLQTALQSGKSIADVAQEKGVSLDTVVNAVLADRTAQLKQQITAQLQAKPGTGGFGPGFAPGFGPGFGPMHGRP